MRVQQSVDKGLKKFKNSIVFGDINEPFDEEPNNASKNVKS